MGHPRRFDRDELQALQGAAVEHQLAAALQLPDQGQPFAPLVYRHAHGPGIGPVQPR